MLRARRERISDSMRTIPTLSLHCRPRLLLVCLAVAFALPQPARAQTSLTITVQEFGGRAAGSLLSGLNGQPISQAECAANTPIPLQLTNVPFSMLQSRFISVWRGTPTSAACNMAANRRPVAGAMPICTFVTSFPIDSTMMQVNLGAGTAFGGECDTNSSQEFWFLTVPAAEDNSTDVPSGEFTFASIPIELDPTAPDAPTELSEGAGDRQIEISWTNPTSATDVKSARVYVDTMGCDASGGVIEGGMLIAGEAPPDDLDPETFGAVRTAQLNGETLGLDIGEYAAVGVTLVDRANNESVLSNIVCIQRVEVRGFWDAYCAERGLSADDCRQRYGCAARPGARGSFGAVLVVGAVFVAFARRKKSRRTR